MKPYPLEASNHLMVPVISTRLAVSPNPEIASIAGSRAALPGYSPDPIRFAAVPATKGPAPFLDSNPSDPINPDLTHQCGPPRRATVPEFTPSSIRCHESARISRIKR